MANKPYIIPPEGIGYWEISRWCAANIGPEQVSWQRDIMSFTNGSLTEYKEVVLFTREEDAAHCKLVFGGSK